MAQLSLATGLLDRPPRDLPEPDWPTDWPVVMAWAGSGLLTLVLVAVWSRSYRRRRAARSPTA
jgi:hypothetical protein